MQRISNRHLQPHPRESGIHRISWWKVGAASFSSASTSYRRTFPRHRVFLRACGGSLEDKDKGKNKYNSRHSTSSICNGHTTEYPHACHGKRHCRNWSYAREEYLKIQRGHSIDDFCFAISGFLTSMDCRSSVRKLKYAYNSTKWQV